MTVDAVLTIWIAAHVALFLVAVARLVLVRVMGA